MMIVDAVRVTTRDYRKTLMRTNHPGRKRVAVSHGEPLRIIRASEGLGSVQLSAFCRVPQAILASIEIVTARMRRSIEIR